MGPKGDWAQTNSIVIVNVKLLSLADLSYLFYR